MRQVIDPVCTRALLAQKHLRRAQCTRQRKRSTADRQAWSRLCAASPLARLLRTCGSRPSGTCKKQLRATHKCHAHMSSSYETAQNCSFADFCDSIPAILVISNWSFCATSSRTCARAVTGVRSVLVSCLLSCLASAPAAAANVPDERRRWDGRLSSARLDDAFAPLLTAAETRTWRRITRRRDDERSILQEKQPVRMRVKAGQTILSRAF